MQGRELRFLCVAVLDKGRVILATCTAPKADFAQYEKVFHACLDSLRLTE